MSLLLYSPAARRDLVELWTEYAVIDEAVADRILARIGQRLEHIQSHPLFGRPRPEFNLDGLRSTAVSPHVIFYSFADETITIHRVVDGRRYLPDLLAPDQF